MKPKTSRDVERCHDQPLEKGLGRFLGQQVRTFLMVITIPIGVFAVGFVSNMSD